MPYKNKTDQAAASKRHYEANKEKVINRTRLQNKERRTIFRQMISDHLSTHPCVDCGESDPIVLDFDHVRGSKSFNISDGSRVASCAKRFQEEIDKCDIRCANCHRRITHKRREILS